jgi:hypothetical protein
MVPHDPRQHVEVRGVGVGHARPGEHQARFLGDLFRLDVGSFR